MKLNIFFRPERSLGWYQVKACLKLKILVLFLRKIEVTSIPQYFFECSDSLNEWNEFFRSSIDSTSHFELPNTEKISFSSG